MDRFAGKPRKGSDILVQALEREGVDTGGLLVQHVIVQLRVVFLFALVSLTSGWTS